MNFPRSVASANIAKYRFRKFTAMKTKLLKRLRREVRVNYPYALLSAFAELVGWNYIQINRYIREEKRNYILRRVAELKQKRK